MEDPRDRVQGFDRLLGQAARAAMSGGATGVCPDASTVAAYVERTLSAQEREAFEAHAASCERCVEALAALLEAGPAAGLGQSAAPEPSRWWRRAWPWMVPLTAAASAAIIYVAVRPAALPHVASAPVVTDQVAVAGRAADDASGETTALPPAVIGDRPGDRPRRTYQQAASEAFGTAPPAASQQSKGEAAGAANVAGAAPAPPPPPAPAPGVAAKRNDAPSTAEAQAPSPSEERETAGAPLPAARSAPLPQAAGRNEAAPRSVVTSKVGHVPEAREIGPASTSPDGSSTWRIRPATGIERSRDGGRTWVPQNPRVVGELLALDAVDATTCWAVGRNGMVLRTLNGERWDRLDFPEALDLAGISADSAMSATVTAVDGRVYRTIDGGRSWSLQ